MLRDRLDRALLAGRVLNRTGVLPSLSPTGVLSFARAVRGTKAGPHVTFMLHAANKPEKLAIVDGARRFTYGGFDRMINQLAHGLVGLGVRGGDRVALMMGNCAEYLLIQHALVRLGATAVQIGYRLKAPEVAYLLENAEPRAVFVHAEQFAVLAEARTAVAARLGQVEQHVVVCGAAPGVAAATHLEDLLAAHREQGDRPPAPSVAGTSAGAVIVYTSGTTGKPKGATRDFKQTGLESVFDFVDRVGMTHDERHLVTSPLYHSAAPAFVAMMFSLGASVVIQDHFEAEEALAAIQRERVTSAFVVPTMLVRLTSLPETVRRRYDTSSLRWVMSGAAPLPTETARRFQEQYGAILWNFYGATETGIVTLAGPADHAARPGTIGRPVRGNELRLLGEDGRDVAPGAVGEVYVRNSMLITGYHRNSDATRSSMRDGFFSVGDLGRVDADGYYYLESRKHDMVISGGVNIYPREIEDHLHTHPEVLEAAVVGVPDAEWGESLRAFVVRRPGSSLDEAAVIEHCRAALADFKRPRSVVFLAELPRTLTGKILKRELRDRTR